jgi:phosphomethylpyrimidine synthase
MTQYEAACAGQVTSEMEAAAAIEGVDVAIVVEQIAIGHAVLPANPAHPGVRATVAGRAFSTKINANIGRSPKRSTTDDEVDKVDVALRAGADFVMDLSVGDDLDTTRRAVLEACAAPVGTVPIYEALSRVGGKGSELTEQLLVDVIRDQAEQGVDFMTIHAGLKRAYVPLALKRKLGICSRGGAILAEWMTVYEKENPFLTRWDEILEICRKHDVTMSLGDGLRPGCLADASDEAQFAELETLGALVQTCRSAGVQVMVEGPGHVPFDQIQMNMERQFKVCDGSPFYVLGPLVTDIAPGYDHITSAIGATAAAVHGASLLCYVTPAEHLSLPSAHDVHEGVIAYKIAAHSADVARGLKGARDRDDAMADARANFDWNRQFELSLDPTTARERYEAGRSTAEGDPDHCSMCGRDFCAVRTTRRLQEGASA